MKSHEEIEPLLESYKSTVVLSLVPEGVTLSNPNWRKAIAQVVSDICTIIEREKIPACFPNVSDGLGILRFSGNSKLQEHHKPAAYVPATNFEQPFAAYL